VGERANGGFNAQLHAVPWTEDVFTRRRSRDGCEMNHRSSKEAGCAPPSNPLHAKSERTSAILPITNRARLREANSLSTISRAEEAILVHRMAPRSFRPTSGSPLNP